MAAGSYCRELLGMLAVFVFLLAAEDYYRASIREQIENTVSCNNMGALYTYAKKSKRVPVSSSNTDIRGALGEVNRRAQNKYNLDHVRGHQYRTVRGKDLSLKARLNTECDEMAKEVVRRSMTMELRDKRH